MFAAARRGDSVAVLSPGVVTTAEPGWPHDRTSKAGDGLGREGVAIVVEAAATKGQDCLRLAHLVAWVLAPGARRLVANAGLPPSPAGQIDCPFVVLPFRTL